MAGRGLIVAPTHLLEVVLGKGGRLDGHGHWVRVERGPALARVATTLLVVVAAYVAGAAETATIRWLALALTLLGILQLGLLLRQLVHREGRRDDLLQAILDSVPHILFYKDAASRYIGVNPVFERTFGVRAEDVVGKTDAELFGQALHDRFVAQDRELLATGGARTFEEQMPIDGEIHYLEVRKTPFHDAQGNAAGIVGLAMDVTDRHLLRQQLERSNARLRNILDNLPVALVWYDDFGRAGLWNRKALALFGYTPEEIDTVDKWFSRAYPDPGYREEVIDRWSAAGAASQAGDISRGEYEITCKDGRVITAEIWGTHCDDVSLAVFDDVTERHRLRRQLEVGNVRLSLALRAARMGTWTWNADTDEFDLDAFEGRLFGLAEGRHHATDLLAGNNIHPDDLEVVRDAARCALREGEAVGYEFRAPDKQNGGWRWSEGSVIRYSEPGKPTMLIGVNRDITERKLQELELTEAKQRAEQALTELEQSRLDLELALQSGQLGIWHSEVRNFDGDSAAYLDQLDVELDVDEHARRIWGRPPGEQITRRIFVETLHPEVRESTLVGIAQAFARGAGDYADHYRIIRTDGAVRTISVLGTLATRTDPETGEEVRSITGVIRDVTDEENLKADLRQKVHEAQLASSALEQSRAELELALRSGRLGVWHSEVPGTDRPEQPDQIGLEQPVDWDANIRRIFGRGTDEPITRRHYFEALHPEDRERVVAGLVDSRGGDYADQYRIVRPDGQVRTIAVHAAMPATRTDPVTGKPMYSMTGIVRDITEEENLKADLRQKAREAQLATEAKARFLAMMSHEIRTPMNGVVGMIELLLETPLSADQQQMLKTCKDSAFVLLTVINDILDFSKIEAGKLELEYTQLSLRRLVEGVGEALGVHATQRGIHLDVEIAPDVPRRVIGDRVRLRQILTNLVGNAIKFTEQGGVVVTVSIERCEPGDGRTNIRFDIVDSGTGMDEEVVRNLFQPFHQADVATTRRFGGTGLGLSIVKHLTELMGGHVECESRLLQGSRFSVVIPFEVATAAKRDWGYPVAGVRILASVAQERRRRILSGFLPQFDVSIEFCDSGDELLARAREAVADGAVDLVLLDKHWSISGCAGLHKRFSETPEISRLPFVVVRSNELVQAQLIPNVTLVNGNPLTRTSLVHGIAVALGRISATVPAIAEDRGGEPVQPLSRDQAAASGQLILLAEDNSTNRDVIARQLARLGYVCDVAEDGARAWAMLTSGDTRYALLLTDCHMPRLDGYELTRRIRGLERNEGTEPLPIVAITANALQGEGERCLALGMNGYLAKPLQSRELKRVLAEFLPPMPADRCVVSSDIGDLSPGDGALRFHELLEILGGDEEKLRHVLGVFERSTRKDCEQLDAAQTVGDWRRIRDLAHKLRSGCRQLGENVAALALEAVEKRAGSDTDPEEEFAVARRELQQVLVRVGAYLSTEPDRHSGGAD